MRRRISAVGSLRFFGGGLRLAVFAAPGQDKQTFWSVKTGNHLRSMIYDLRLARNARAKAISLAFHASLSLNDAADDLLRLQRHDAAGSGGARRDAAVSRRGLGQSFQRPSRRATGAGAAGRRARPGGESPRRANRAKSFSPAAARRATISRFSARRACSNPKAGI